MLEFRHLVIALVAGFVTGFVVCLPIGPVNLTVINTALRKGFLAAFLVGLGAVCAEMIYVSLAMAGHASLPHNRNLLVALRAAAVVVVAVLGVRNLLMKTAKFELRSEAVAERMDQRWHHPRSFLLGFLLVISNLGLIVLWATVTSALHADDFVDMDLRAIRWTCGTGVAMGAITWFFVISWLVSRAHRRITPQALAWLARGCGVVFLIFAALLLVNLISPRI